jgi:hypothetical protein
MKNSLLPLWNENEWIPPRRSRLYSISPQAQGTPMVEALHSLVIRLARAHNVKPHVLVKEEVLRDCEINYTKHSAKFVTTYLSTMNGLGKYAREIKDSLESLTMQSRLDECTFLRWEDLFQYRSRRMLHSHPHWCPVCFAEWRKTDIEPYYPLIWQSTIVQFCPVHHVPLEQKCPACQKTQPFIPRHYFLDHCSYCHGSLAQPDSQPTERGEQRISSDAQQAIDTIAEMIMLDQSAQHLLNAEHFWERLKETADKFCDGQIKPFEKILGFSEGTFSNWKLGRHKPSFPAFYRLTRSLGTTPVAFLTDGAIETFSPHSIASKPRKTRRAHLKHPEKDQISKALHAIIDQGYSERPMREVAARIGYAHRYLIYWFPDQCRQISQLHRNWVSEQIERRADERGDLTVATVRELYSGHLRVTRGLVHTELRKLGLSLKDPVVRDAFYDVRAEQIALRGEHTEAE